MSGFFLRDGPLFFSPCIACLQSCDVCSKTTECTKCKDGFFNSALKDKCNKCTDGCKTCTAATGCQECFSNFSLDSKKEKCDVNGVGILLIFLLIFFGICCLGCLIWVCCIYVCVATVQVVSDPGMSYEVQPTTVIYEEHY